MKVYNGNIKVEVDSNGIVSKIYLGADEYEVTGIKELPVLPTDASTKTYVLKAVNGTLTWVEETVEEETVE